MQYYDSKKHYRFHRLTTATRWDKYKKKKLVVTQLDHTSDDYTLNLSGEAEADDDFPIKFVEMGYWPYKGSFFWFVKGSLFLKNDNDATTDDPCDATFLSNNAGATRCDRSDRNKIKDPCDRNTPLFATGATLNHKKYAVSTDDSITNYAVAFETVFDSIFVVFSAE